jgi:hypothetical protein
MNSIKNVIEHLDTTHQAVLDYYLNTHIDDAVKVVIIYDKINNREDLRRHY